MIYDPIGFAGTATGRDKVELIGPQVFNPNDIRYKSYNYPSFYSAKKIAATSARWRQPYGQKLTSS